MTLMEVVPCTVAEGEPPIWIKFRKTIDQYETDITIGFEDLFALYERAKQAFATVQTCETVLYACVILKKGVIRAK